MSSLTLRKPSRAPLASVEAFVNRDEESAPQPAIQLAPPTSAEQPAETQPTPNSIEPNAIIFRRASRAMAPRRTKPDRRRVTVYLDLDVASELAAYVATADKEMSVVVNDALRAWLTKKRA